MSIDLIRRLFGEERIILLSAETEQGARRLAEQIGKSEEHEYLTSRPNDLLRWSFEKIERMYAVEEDTLTSGTELLARFLRQSEVESLLTPFDDEDDTLD